MSRRKPPSWVFLEWDQLVLANGARLSLEEREKRWRALLDRTYIAGHWEVDAGDAELVSNLGCSLAWERNDYVGALQNIQRWFEHPKAVCTEAPEARRRYLDALHHLSTAEMATGEIEAGLNHARELFRQEKPPLWARRRANVKLQIYSETIEDRGARVDPQIIEFLREVMAQSRGTKRMLASLPNELTHAELTALLDRLWDR